MALQWLLVLELGLYAGSFICGIIAAASVTITQGHFAGLCILYGTAHFNKTTPPYLTMVNSSSPSLCHFVTAISVCVAVYCFSLTLYWIYNSCVDQEVTRGRIWMNVTLVICGIFLFFLLVTGCVLRIGRNRLCESIVQQAAIPRCELAQSIHWSPPYVGLRFFSSLQSAETSVWVNFFVWLIIVVAVVIQRRRGSEFTAREADPNASPSETEPFFPRPARPQ